MFKNYFKIAWRNLLRNKLYSAINIAGLGSGLAVCMLIVLYVGHESQYDRFHSKADRIFLTETKIKAGNDSLYMTTMGFSTAPSVKLNDPAVESFLRIKKADRNTVIQNAQSPSIKFAEDKFLFADSNFFTFFSFKLLRGNKEQVLQNPFSVVISQNAAEKYFGKQDPVGKTIRYDNAYDFTITGVAEKTPSNSSIGYDFVGSLSSMLSIPGERNHIQSDENAFSTYFLLKHPEDGVRIEADLLRLEKARNANSATDSRYIAIPLKDIHKYADIDTSNMKYLKIFPLVAALILLLALINYTSLSTARATIRSKEIGVRKVLGAGRITIATQFFIESALNAAIAFILGYLICLFFEPAFFKFLQIDIDNSFLYSPYMLLSFALLFILTVLLAATYPSILLSAYTPVMVFYSKYSKNGGGGSVRKFLTVVQFTISVILVICSIVIGRQMYFIKHADTGVDRENVIMIPFARDIGKHYASFKARIKALPGVLQISAALHPMYKGYDIMGTTPKNSDQMVLLPMLSVDQHFISLLGLKWKIPPADSFFYMDKKTTAILNETAVEKLNLGNNPISQKIDDKTEIAGVLKDFNYSSLQNKIQGLCLFVTKDNDTSSLWAQQGGCVFAKINSHISIPVIIQKLKDTYEKFDNETPFEYHFMDEAFDAQYKAEDRLLKIFSAFTAFAVFIASLGLFGLATFMATQRTKEIGIRKVLGASVRNLVLLLSKDFIKPVAIAIIIALPVAWLAMNKWLEDFAFRINVSWEVLLLAAFIALAVALFTISFQTIKAAIANPVKSLRTE